MTEVALLEDWTIDLPSGYARDVEPDGAVVLWDETTTIRAITVATSGRADGSQISAEEMLGNDLGKPRRLPTGLLVAVGDEFVEEIDGKQVWTLLVAAAAPNHLLSLAFHTRFSGQLGWVPDAALTLEKS